MTTDFSPLPWTGRDDGPGPQHRRWHHAVNSPTTDETGIALLGFRSDEGVRRNNGRVGAAEAPAAIRTALSSLSADSSLVAADLGDVTVVDGDMESGQRTLGTAVAAAIDSGNLTIVLGGGHETAYGSYLGLRASSAMAGKKLGILNLDAHFDLRSDPVPSSGTPFLQIAVAEAAEGRDLDYRIVGISEPNNTATLFETAAEFNVRYLRDEECGIADVESVKAFVADFLGEVDAVYLTIDLDVLPGYLAPGVSAPAALGVPFEVVLAVCNLVANTPKLVHVDVVELNPRFDIDNRTARAAARLIHTIAAAHANTRRTVPASPNHPWN